MGTLPVAIATEGSSFGVSAGGTSAPLVGSATGTLCNGITSHNAIYTSAAGFGTVSIQLKRIWRYFDISLFSTVLHFFFTKRLKPFLR